MLSGFLSPDLMLSGIVSPFHMLSGIVSSCHSIPICGPPRTQYLQMHITGPTCAKDGVSGMVCAEEGRDRWPALLGGRNVMAQDLCTLRCLMKSFSSTRITDTFVPVGGERHGWSYLPQPTIVESLFSKWSRGSEALIHSSRCSALA